MTDEKIAAIYDQASRLDARITPGMRVQARWRHAGHDYSAEATVVSVNPQSVTVCLDHPVMAAWGEPFAQGFELLLPRPMFPRWAPYCGAFPITD